MQSALKVDGAVVVAAGTVVELAGGAAVVDAAPPVVDDAGAPVVDPEAPVVDAGAPVVDPAAPVVDAGAPVVDPAAAEVVAGASVVAVPSMHVIASRSACVIAVVVENFRPNQPQTRGFVPRGHLQAAAKIFGCVADPGRLISSPAGHVYLHFFLPVKLNEHS